MRRCREGEGEEEEEERVGVVLREGNTRKGGKMSSGFRVLSLVRPFMGILPEVQSAGTWRSHKFVLLNLADIVTLT